MAAVSIIMPMFNASKFIDCAITSVQNQSFQDWEMIIVDDCSNDNSLAIAEKFGQSDSRIVVIANQRNMGIAETRNLAIKAAKSRFIAFLDSDDMWLPTKLENQLNFMMNENFPICYSSYYTMNINGFRTGLRLIPQLTDYYTLLKNNHIGTLTTIYDTLFFGKQYFLNIHHEDYEMWLRLFKKLPNPIFGIQEPLAEYRIHARSKSYNKLKTVLWRWNIYRNIEKLSLIQTFFYMMTSVFNIFIRILKSKLQNSVPWKFKLMRPAVLFDRNIARKPKK